MRVFPSWLHLNFIRTVAVAISLRLIAAIPGSYFTADPMVAVTV
jgi:hypothetical protein